MQSSQTLAMPAGPILIGLPGTELTADDLEHLMHPAVGGVVLFTRNFSSLEQLEQISELIPQDWYPAALGTPRECAEYWQLELDSGADAVCIHGSTPAEFEPALSAYRELRQQG